MTKNKIEKLSIDKLTDIVNNNDNAFLALKDIGYEYPTSTYAELLFKRCQELGIDYNHLFYDTKTQKPCLKCGKVKPLSDFYSKRAVCKDCVRKEEREKYHTNNTKLNDFKKKHGCKKCGDKRFYILDFHHIDPSEKDYTISDNPNIKFENLATEIEKCVLLCANCHREFHYLNRTENLSLEDYLGGWGKGSPTDC